MQKIRDIIRVRADTQLSERQIGRALKVSRSVVAKTLAQFRASGLKRETAEAMSDSELDQALWRSDPVAANPRYAVLAEQFAAMEMELKQKGMTLERLWQRYLDEQPEGYQYSQFCLHFHRWTAGGELSMHVEHKAGEQMYADWAGEPLVVVNANTGEPWALDVFVGILGASGLTWVAASEGREQECWIRVNEGALRYFGGSPEALIPDNLKTGVTKSDRYEPEINPVFEEFARHYGLVVFPARVRRPRDKDHASDCTSLRTCVASFGWRRRSRKRLPGWAVGNGPRGGSQRICPRSSARTARNTPSWAKRFAVEE